MFIFIDVWMTVNPQRFSNKVLNRVPVELSQFQGHIFVGFGQALRIYNLGKRKIV